MFGAKLARLFGISSMVLCFISSPVFALGSQPVISHLKTGETGFATKEFIAIYNNSDQPVDVTGWCLQYSSASDLTKSTLNCLAPPSSDVSLMLQPFSYARFSSTEFGQDFPLYIPDGQFSAGLSGTSGHVRLLDKAKNEVDKLGWGAAANPETNPAATHASGYVLMRKMISTTTYMQGTNNNSVDFEQALLASIPESGIIEQQILADVCPNISDTQTTIPDDYFLDAIGNCVQDLCDNIEGLQADIPDNFESLDGTNCTEKVVKLESAILQITELLPNVSSTDTGKEYIEIYNPNNKQVQLEGYKLELGPAYTKNYILKNQLLEPLAYTTFSDILSGLILPNSSASLRLVAPAGITVSDVPAYESPKDDEAWALINDIWQYTNNPTPNLANLPSKTVQSSSSGDTADVAELPDCGPGKYRNPDTNRCKTIVTGDEELTPCSAGQVRNPDTNRCRSLGSVNSLVPCKEGQERNPDTNRCRSIVTTASALQPCPAGQERNPDTNRCKKSATLGASTMSDVQDVPTTTTDSSSNNWWLIGGVIAAAGGYGIYEWRSEIFRGLSRFRPKP